MSTRRKVVAVRFEGTLSPNANRELMDIGDDPDPAVKAKLKEHYEAGDYIIVVSNFANLGQFVGELQRFLIHTGVDFHDVWVNSGFPEADIFYDNSARRIRPARNAS